MTDFESKNMQNDLSTYIRQLIPEGDPWLAQIEKGARERYIPILDAETASFLNVFLAAVRPKRILEIGSAIGYSAIVMARACEASILTIERDDQRYEEARANIEQAALNHRITLVHADALDVLTELVETSYGEYDMIFLDAAKGQYPRFLELVLPLLREDGVLLSDNIFFHGLVAGTEHVKHKLRTLVVRLREYNETIANHPQLHTTFLQMGDGLAISVRRGND